MFVSVLCKYHAQSSVVGGHNRLWPRTISSSNLDPQQRSGARTTPVVYFLRIFTPLIGFLVRWSRYWANSQEQSRTCSFRGWDRRWSHSVTVLCACHTVLPLDAGFRKCWSDPIPSAYYIILQPKLCFPLGSELGIGLKNRSWMFTKWSFICFPPLDATNCTLCYEPQ